MKKLTFILIGAGMRGQTYAKMACLDHGCQLVGVAEPLEERRNNIRDTYGVPEDMCFSDYKALLALGKIADFAMICTQDRMHVEPALMAIDLKYDLLLEKPVAPTPQECIQIADAAEAKGVRVLVCHVLRYTKFFKAVKELIDSGRIGRIMSIVHTEGVGNVHQSHSFVRGNWSNSKNSSPMLLQKSCHDLDILQWLLGAKCKKVQSFGRLSYFTRENCPQGAPYRCIEGCPHGETCPYNAVTIYTDPVNYRYMRYAAANVSLDSDLPTEKIDQVLRETNYGVCAFQCDNNVVDHQTVNLEYENGETVVFTMAAFNLGGRRIRIMGTKGEINSDDLDTLELITFCDDRKDSPHYGHKHTETIKTSEIGINQSITGGHGGGDGGIIGDLYQLFAEGIATKSVSDIRTSINNHLTVFAAEESRKTDRVVFMDEYVNSL